MTYGSGSVFLGMDFLDALGTDNFMLIVHFLLVMVSWIYLYRSRNLARVKLLWGIITLALPFIGSWAVLVFYLWRRAKES